MDIDYIQYNKISRTRNTLFPEKSGHLDLFLFVGFDLQNFSALNNFFTYVTIFLIETVIIQTLMLKTFGCQLYICSELLSLKVLSHKVTFSKVLFSKHLYKKLLCSKMLRSKVILSLLSGDNVYDRNWISKHIGGRNQLHQTPDV
jgi:hypothetical protein